MGDLLLTYKGLSKSNRILTQLRFIHSMLVSSVAFFKNYLPINQGSTLVTYSLNPPTFNYVKTKKTFLLSTHTT